MPHTPRPPHRPRAKRQQQSARLLFALRSAPLAALALLAVLCALPFIARTRAADTDVRGQRSEVSSYSSLTTHNSSRFSWLGGDADIYTTILASRSVRAVSPATFFANTQNDLTAASGTASLSTPGNWSLGHVPTVSEDATYTGTTTGIRSLTAANLTVGSFNITGSSGTFSIRNNTSGPTDSNLTLGGAGSTGNSVSGNSADLLYCASGSTFALRGDNGSTGTGVLKMVLGQSGNFNAAGTMNVTSVVSDGGSGFGITKTGAGTLTLSGANTYTGNTTISAGTLALSGSGSIAGSPNIGVAGGATFDVTGLTTSLTLASGQGLSGTGTAATGTIATSATKGLTTGANSPLSFVFNGTTAPLTISGAGTVTLQSGNQTSVLTTTALGAGDYTLISKGPSGVVGGSVPTLLPISGAGLAAGMVASLQLTGNQLILHVAAPSATLVVTKTADTDDGFCDADCSLREAINVANVNGDTTTINFAIGSGQQTISPTSPLPEITSPVILDATTQPGFAGTPIIELDGTNARRSHYDWNTPHDQQLNYQGPGDKPFQLPRHSDFREQQPHSG